ncbi:ly6/PLAUR domain-containing protein 2-like [Dendropsophus ebraccatus]|uniref:ly6/PLAUR domain-containing protein 2-like n=1 Tax=Dendropsophus ebraccatus TaxID=150705 RepID=UPI003831013A
MKLSLGLAVAAAVCLEIAQGLMCYTCNSLTTSSECNDKTNCTALSPKFAFCKTNVMSPEEGFPFTGNEQVVRQCAEKCEPTGQNWLGVTRKILCCNLDFCNRNGIQDGASEAGGGGDCSKGTTSAANRLTTSLLLLSAVTYSI